MKILYSAFSILIIALVFGCQREVSYGLPEGVGDNNSTNAIFRGTIQGNVLDEKGNPSPGVNVKVGDIMIQTDSRGQFHIVEAMLSKVTTMVTAEKSGYFKAFRTFSATSGANNVSIKLIKRNLAGRVSATGGGTVALTNGTKITLPANGVVKASGSQFYSGEINIYSAYIDPTAADITTTIPGSLLAKDKDGKEVLLKSFGMVAVELESSAGEKLQIANGKAATLVMPIPTSLQSNAPSTIPLWFVNEETGIWNEEGSAVKNGNVYTGDVRHFSNWNLDVSIATLRFTAKFITGHGSPLINVHVFFRTTNGSGGYGDGTTDSLGQISATIPANMPLVLELTDRCLTVIYSKNIGPFTFNTDLGTINVSGSIAPASIVTLKGKLVNCNNTAVTKGAAIIYYDNYGRFVSVNNNGEFSTTYLRCPSSPGSFEIIGVDETAIQQGVPVHVSVTPPTTDAGAISACGISASEYINYTLNGVQHSITNLSDSLNAYGSNLGNVEISGASRPTNNQILFRFITNGTADAVPLQSLTIDNKGTQFVTNPFNVILTEYAVSPGQFYEGSFSGLISYGGPQGSPTYWISCSFRVRRN